MQGFKLKNHLLDMEGGETRAHSWRCTNCGAVHDAVIERNRRAGPDTHEGDIYLGGEAFIRPVA